MAKFITFFHLNPSFSAISTAQRKTVIDQCYWPILMLARDYGLKISIECSAIGLLQIQKIDPEWIICLRRHIDLGKIELIGCGYVQAIAPLMPLDLLSKNLEMGNRLYHKICGSAPTIALINEQAFIKQMVRPYLEHHYQAIIMDHAAFGSAHPSHKQLDGLSPCAVADDRETDTLPLLWTSSFIFQQFQRYVHGDSSLDYFMNFLKPYLARNQDYCLLYGSDAEVLGYRPGRYGNERAAEAAQDWRRLYRLFETLSAHESCHYQDQLNAANAHPLPLIPVQTIQNPVIVKKQHKYNITRWAVTGAADLALNLFCYRYDQLLKENGANDDQWQDLLLLWRSDYRTHIEAKRWNDLMRIIDDLGTRHPALIKPPANITPQVPYSLSLGKHQLGDFSVDFVDDFININWAAGSLRLNTRRGLAIDGVSTDPDAVRAWQDFDPAPRWFGTLYHGHFKDINHAADFYSGHLVLEPPASHKITDLHPIIPYVGLDHSGKLMVYARIETPKGDIIKQISVNPEQCQFDIEWQANWLFQLQGSLRLGFVTLRNDEAMRLFDPHSLSLETAENSVFSLGDHIQDFNHGAAVSHLVSANQAIPLSKGDFVIKDHTGKEIQIDLSPLDAPLIAMAKKITVRGTPFIRIWLSAQEMDETNANHQKRLESNQSTLPIPRLKISHRLLDKKNDFK